MAADEGNRGGHRETGGGQALPEREPPFRLDLEGKAAVVEGGLQNRLNDLTDQHTQRRVQRGGLPRRAWESAREIQPATANATAHGVQCADQPRLNR